MLKKSFISSRMEGSSSTTNIFFIYKILAANITLSDVYINYYSFFSLYLSFCENPNDFFGKPLVDLSVYQLKMVVFGRVFQSIFQHVEDIPDDIRDDPERLLAFADAKQNRNKGGKSFIDEDAAGSTVFGGTPEDIKDLNQSGGPTVSLSEEIKKAGGKLDMEQMMKMAGQ